MLTYTLLLVSGFASVNGGVFGKQASSTTPGSASSTVPNYFQTSPEIYAGPTPSGPAAFLAQTNPAPFGTVSYIPNTPLETQVPIIGNTNNSNIFQLMGNLAHYFPNPIGFGVDEFSLPKGASITYLYMLSRHGSRYPTTGSGGPTLGNLLVNLTSNGTSSFFGNLSFINTWTNKLGAEILVPVGRSELFDSGVLHQYMYGHLYPNNGSKIIARSTTQDRMTESAEWFLAGFFGRTWTQNATLELIIEEPGFNISLTGSEACTNANNYRSRGGANASAVWESVYLKDAVNRFNKQSSGFNWTIADVYNAQTLCPYETVALGYSAWCDLFTYEEWLGYEYSIDLSFAGNNGFQSPTGRAVGIGWQQELLARLKHEYITGPDANVNWTLDAGPTTFPVNQSLNFDFTHDTNIMSVLAALGLTQFNATLNETAMEPHDLIVAHLEPFAARMDIEVINAPSPVAANRTRTSTNVYESGDATQYIHFIINQRTLPLGKSFAACGNRTDGWCELNTFIEIQNGMLNESQYDYSCYGNYSAASWGQITNGVPLAQS